MGGQRDQSLGFVKLPGLLEISQCCPVRSIVGALQPKGNEKAACKVVREPVLQVP